MDQILRHERVHVSQHHTLDVLLTECLTIVFWFNPVAYLFRRLMTQNLEYLACDAGDGNASNKSGGVCSRFFGRNSLIA
ncbi:MAG: hypothetical protein LH609_04620 [Rudanella sp.]|nr:hypothetical protein [Rudanella sp.]